MRNHRSLNVVELSSYSSSSRRPSIHTHDDLQQRTEDCAGSAGCISRTMPNRLIRKAGDMDHMVTCSHSIRHAAPSIRKPSESCSTPCFLLSCQPPAFRHTLRHRSIGLPRILLSHIFTSSALLYPIVFGLDRPVSS